MARREGYVHRVLQQLDPAQARPELLAHAAELEQQREVELPGAQARNDLLRLALGQAQLDVGVRRAEAGDRQRHQRRPGGRERGHPQPPAPDAGDRGEVGLGRLEPGQDPLRMADQGAAGGSRPHAAPVALDERHPGLGLQRRHRLRNGGLREGEGFGRGRERPAQHDLPEDAQAGYVEH